MTRRHLLKLLLPALLLWARSAVAREVPPNIVLIVAGVRDDWADPAEVTLFREDRDLDRRDVARLATRRRPPSR